MNSYNFRKYDGVSMIQLLDSGRQDIKDFISSAVSVSVGESRYGTDYDNNKAEIMAFADMLGGLNILPQDEQASMDDLKIFLQGIIDKSISDARDSLNCGIYAVHTSKLLRSVDLLIARNPRLPQELIFPDFKRDLYPGDSFFNFTTFESDRISAAVAWKNKFHSQRTFGRGSVEEGKSLQPYCQENIKTFIKTNEGNLIANTFTNYKSAINTDITPARNIILKCYDAIAQTIKKIILNIYNGLLKIYKTTLHVCKIVLNAIKQVCGWIWVCVKFVWRGAIYVKNLFMHPFRKLYARISGN